MERADYERREQVGNYVRAEAERRSYFWMAMSYPKMSVDSPYYETVRQSLIRDVGGQIYNQAIERLKRDED